MLRWEWGLNGWMALESGRKSSHQVLGPWLGDRGSFLLFLHLRNKKISSDHLQKGQMRVDMERQTGPCREWLGDTRSRSTSSLSGPTVEVGAGTGGGGCLHRTKGGEGGGYVDAETGHALCAPC